MNDQSSNRARYSLPACFRKRRGNMAPGQAGHPPVQRQVRFINAHIQNGQYGAAGSRYHSLNFRFVRQAQEAGFLQNLNIEPRIEALGGSAVGFRKPDYMFGGGGIYDLKVFRPSPNAYNPTPQFQDIVNTTGQMPIPLYYRLP
jgi:hypothetical protein